MITNEERHEIAKRLRDYESLRESFRESPICAFLDALGVEGYMDWKSVCNLLADLIEPERTCKQVLIECDDGLMPPFTVHCSECGDKWGYTPNHCPNCGTKVQS